MLRSLYSGVSGLTAHQSKMDVIGNNIANVNTYGFKSSRVTFRDIYYQTSKSASGGTDAAGGVNPSQVGYGVSVSSVDKNMSRSSFQSSASSLDLAIAGEGFIQVQDKAGNKFYTRAGNLQVDNAGNLIDANGKFVLGTQNSDPTNTQGLSPNAGYGKINISVPDVNIATVTKDVNVASIQPVVLGSPKVTIGFLNGNQEKDISIKITGGKEDAVTKYDTSSVPAVLEITVKDSLSLKNVDDLAARINTIIQNEIDNPSTPATPLMTVDNFKAGKIGITVSTEGVTGGTVANPTALTTQQLADIQKAAVVGIAPDVDGATNAKDNAQKELDKAKADLVTAQGKVTTSTASEATAKAAADAALAAKNTADATLAAAQAALDAAKAANNVTTLTSSLSAAISTLKDVSTIKATLTAAETAENAAITAATANADATVKAAATSTTNAMAQANTFLTSISSLLTSTTDTAANTTSLTNAQNAITAATAAGGFLDTLDTAIANATTLAGTSVDPLLTDLNNVIAAATNVRTAINAALTAVNANITPVVTANAALATANTAISGAQTAFDAANADATAKEKAYTTEKGKHDAAVVALDTAKKNVIAAQSAIDAAQAKFDSAGLQLDNATAAAGSTQDLKSESKPQSFGSLTSFTIGENGVLTGVHAVHGILTFGRIDLATFDNPGGLEEAGTSYFAATSASGNAKVTNPGMGGSGNLVGSALEMSNVNLAQEFSDMITTQRGFQANSRIITTSDEMLQELVNLKK